MNIKYSKHLTPILLLLIIKTCTALYSKNNNVVELTPSNFDNLVLKGDEVWVVEFYAPWCQHCKNLVADFTKVADALKGIVKVGAVNADVHKELGSRYNIKGFPTLKIFGADPKKPEEYADALNPKQIAEAALKAAKSKILSRLNLKEEKPSSKQSKTDYVVELTDQNFKETVLKSTDIWMVEFYAPWCGHCKNLAPHWKQAAQELKGKVKFGALDSTVHQAQASKYGIKGYPTIKLFTPGSDPIDYNGGRTASDIVAWASEFYEDNLPTPEVHQITNEKVVKDECDGKQLSIMAFLPHILDCQSSCRNAYITILKNLASRLKKNNLCWLWSEAVTQPNIEETFRVGGSGYPALIAVSYNHKSYSTFVGAFTEDDIYKFLINLYAGRGVKNTFDTGSVPKVINIEPWDGKDGVVPEEDDDYDDKDEL